MRVLLIICMNTGKSSHHLLRVVNDPNEEDLEVLHRANGLFSTQQGEQNSSLGEFFKWVSNKESTWLPILGDSLLTQGPFDEVVLCGYVE